MRVMPLVLLLYPIIVTRVIIVTAAMLNMTFVRSSGSRISTSNSAINVFEECVTAVKCAVMCQKDVQCNGFNYHSKKQICEVIPYTVVHELSSDSIGWNLWLPRDCPNISQRPDFIESNYSVMVDGTPVIGDIYCLRVDNFHTLAYLNLPSGPESNFLVGNDTEMEFTKYGLNLDTLTIRLDDFAFSTITKGTEPLPVGFVDNCSGCDAATATSSEIKFNITGTQFMLGDDISITCIGYAATSIHQVQTDQTAESACVACCGKSYVRDGNGDTNGQITLKLVR